jgi:hypothetical protein
MIRQKKPDHQPLFGGRSRVSDALAGKREISNAYHQR